MRLSEAPVVTPVAGLSGGAMTALALLLGGVAARRQDDSASGVRLAQVPAG